MKKEHYNEIDVLKGLGIIAVYLGHSFNLSGLNFNEVMIYIYKSMYSFHLPMFFLISGFLSNTGKEINLKKFYINKIKRLWIPYLFINFIDYFPRTLFPSLVNSEFEGIRDVIFYGTKISWFIYTLFILFMIFPILEKYIFSKDKYYISGIVILLLNIFKIGTDIKIFALGSVIYHLIYFYIGYIIKDIYKNKILNGKIVDKKVFILIFILYLGFSYKYFYLNLYTHIIFALIGSLFYFNISIRLNSGKMTYNFFKFCGNESLTLYLLEGFITVFYRVFLFKVISLEYSCLTISLFFILRVITGYLVIKYIIIKSSILSFLLGTRKEIS